MTRELTASKNHRWMSWYVFSVFSICYSASCLVNKTAPAAVAKNGHMQVAFANIVYNLVSLLRDIQAEEVRVPSLMHADTTVSTSMHQSLTFAYKHILRSPFGWPIFFIWMHILFCQCIAISIPTRYTYCRVRQILKTVISQFTSWPIAPALPPPEADGDAPPPPAAPERTRVGEAQCTALFNFLKSLQDCYNLLQDPREAGVADAEAEVAAFNERSEKKKGADKKGGDKKGDKKGAEEEEQPPELPPLDVAVWLHLNQSPKKALETLRALYTRTPSYLRYICAVCE